MLNLLRADIKKSIVVVPAKFAHGEKQDKTHAVAETRWGESVW
jgi:hypothetical protein